MTKIANAWANKRGADVAMLQQTEALRIEAMFSLADCERDLFMELAADSFIYHPRCFPVLAAALADAASAGLGREGMAQARAVAINRCRGHFEQVPSAHEVIVHGQHCCFKLPVPKFRCLQAGCLPADREFEAGPLHLSCWASSPSALVDPTRSGPIHGQGLTRWFTQSMLADLERLTNMAGASITAFCAYQDAKVADVAAYEAVLRTGGPASPSPHEHHPLNHKLVGEAYFALMRARALNEEARRAEVGFNIGIFRHCPACSSWLLDDGLKNFADYVCLCSDGSVTFSESANTARAGRASGVPSQIRHFFGRANDLCLESEGAGGGGGRAGGGGDGGGEAAEGGAGQVDPERAAFAAVHNNITCCRPGEGKVNSPTGHSFGVCLGCCSHNMPAVGTLVNMRSPERFSHHQAIFETGIVANPSDKIRLFSLDYSCLFGPSIMDVFLDGRWIGAVGRDEVRFVVDWLHAKGHKAVCRFKNGALYIEGTGRVIGAQMEQLWSWVSRGRLLFPAMSELLRPT